MNVEAMTKWIEALEDPANERRQIRYLYYDGAGGVCATGLGREVLGTYTTMQFIDVIGGHNLTLVRGADQVLTSVEILNDAGWSFWDIAQALRATHLKENT